MSKYFRFTKYDAWATAIIAPMIIYIFPSIDWKKEGAIIFTLVLVRFIGWKEGLNDGGQT